jgi:nucleoid DNA-binding protein
MPPENRKTILKTHLINALHKEFPDHYKSDLALFTDIVLDTIVSSLREGKRVEIRGFGSFNVHRHRCKDFINPKTGKLTKCSTRKRVVFKPGKDLRPS